VSNMLWHADVSSLFWLMAVKVDGRSRTQNQEKTWTCCATHGNSLQYEWKLEACQRFFEHDCRQEAMPTKRFAWGDWDTLRHIETFKSM
jgi:hypothetical protein